MALLSRRRCGYGGTRNRPVRSADALCLIGDTSSRLRPAHLARSIDGGKHWRFLKAASHDIDATAVAIEPRDPNTIYAATQFQGVLRTTDGGATWRPFNAGLLARAISTLALDRSGTWLYAGTSGAGVVRVRIH